MEALRQSRPTSPVRPDRKSFRSFEMVPMVHWLFTEARRMPLDPVAFVSFRAMVPFQSAKRCVYE